MAAMRVFVRDVEVAKRFYIEGLGFSLSDQWGPAIAIVRLDDLDLWLSGPKSSAAKPWKDGTVPSPGGFCRPVLPAGDWAVRRPVIEAAGGLVLNGPLKGPGGTQIIIADPDGNTIELFE